jgi:hypothetical protein
MYENSTLAIYMICKIACKNALLIRKNSAKVDHVK